MPTRAVTVVIAGDSAGARAAFAKTEAASAKMAASLNRDAAAVSATNAKTAAATSARIKKGVNVLALAGVAAAAVSVKMAAQYQQATTLLVTGAGESEKSIGLVRKGLLDMAPAVGIGPVALAKAMFLVESAGFHGAAGLLVMKSAAEGAKIGGAEATVVADGLTTALKDYNLPASQAAHVTSQLVATVAAGKTNMGDLSASLAHVLPFAAALKVSFTDISGAMATMTGQGILADDAATYLKFTLMSLANETPKGKKALESVGLTAAKVHDDLGKKGLSGTLAELTDAIGKKFPVGSAGFTAALAAAVGGTRGMASALALTGSHTKDLTANIKSISAATTESGGHVKGWAATSKDLNIQLDKMKAGVQATATTIGGDLIPVLTTVVGFVGKHAKVFEVLGVTILGVAVAIKAVALAQKVWITGSAALRAVGIAFGFVGTEAAAGATAVGAADARIVAANDAAAASARGLATAQGSMAGRFGPVAAAAAAGGFLEAKGFQAATEAGKAHGAAVGYVSKAVNFMIPGFSIATGMIDGWVGSLKRGNVVSGEGSVAITKVTKAAVPAAAAMQTGATAADAVAAAMKAAHVQAGDLATAFSGLADKGMNAEQANIAFRNSEDSVASSVKQGGRSLSINTAAGRANVSAVLSSIQAAQAHAAAVGKQTGSLKLAGAAFDTDVGALRRHLVALHLQPAAIQDIISRYGHMPKSVTTKIKAQDEASSKLAAVRRALDLINGRTAIATILLNQKTVTNKVAAGSAGHHASGGTVTGAGTSKSDSNLEWLSIGEEVIQEPYASRNRAMLKAINSGREPALANVGAGSAGGGQDLHVHLYLDGQQVQQSLLRLKRQRGGNLGLA
jgi:TP901 family phage tail tape measure protein